MCEILLNCVINILIYFDILVFFRADFFADFNLYNILRLEIKFKLLQNGLN